MRASVREEEPPFPASDCVAPLCCGRSDPAVGRRRFPNGDRGAVRCEDEAVRVPIYVPSFDFSGITFMVSVGDAVSWQLAVTDDLFVPAHLLKPVEVQAEPFDDPLPPEYYPTVVRRGSFVAWWDSNRPVSGSVTLNAPCSMHDSRLPSEDFPLASGTVVRLHWALTHLRQRSDGLWGDLVRGIGLVDVPSTEYRPDQPSLTGYFPTADAPELTGRWRHIGWIATVEFRDTNPQVSKKR